MYTNEAKNGYVRVYPNKDAIRQMQLKSFEESSASVSDTSKNIFLANSSSVKEASVSEQFAFQDKCTDFLLILILISDNFKSDDLINLLLLCLLISD